MNEIKTTSETIVVSGTETWEDLGYTKVYTFSCNGKCIDPCGLARVLFKRIAGLGNRFKVVYDNISYTPRPSKSIFDCNAEISGDKYLYIEGFGKA